MIRKFSLYLSLQIFAISAPGSQQLASLTTATQQQSAVAAPLPVAATSPAAAAAGPVVHPSIPQPTSSGASRETAAQAAAAVVMTSTPAQPSDAPSSTPAAELTKSLHPSWSGQAEDQNGLPHGTSADHKLAAAGAPQQADTKQSLELALLTSTPTHQKLPSSTGLQVSRDPGELAAGVKVTEDAILKAADCF